MTDQTLTFRDATLDDVGDVVAIVESAYRGESGRKGWTLEASVVEGQRTDVPTISALVASTDARIILAHRGAEFVGCCLVQRRETGAYLGMLSVRPDLQGGGVGGALVAEAERRAAHLFGQDRVDIQVLREDTRLVDWYEKRGYVQSGATLPFAAAGARPKRPLHFVTMAKRLTR